MTDAQFLAWATRPESLSCVLVEVAVYSAGTETTRYLSSKGYVTGAGDTPANVTYSPCIAGGVSVSESLPINGKPTLAWGDIEIANTNGERDDWLNDVWSGRRVRILVGDVRWPRADFRTVFSGVVENITSRAADRLNLLLRDKSQQLNAAITEETLAGTSLTKDTLKPLCFGEVHNVTPLLVDPGTLTYMVHNGPVEDIIEVRDNGIPVSFGKSLTTGKFALSASPVGTITASVQGSKAGNTYRNTVGALVQHLALTYGPNPLTTDDIDVDQIAAFAAAHTQPVGIYISSRANLLDVMQQLAASVGAQVVFTPEGKLQIKKIALPQTGTPTEFTTANIALNSLAISSTPDLQPSCRLGYCRNYTVQSGLTTGLPADHAALYGQEWLVVQVDDETTADLWKLATAPNEVDTLLLRQADTQSEATRRLGLWGTRRTVLKFDSGAGALLCQLGGPARLTHPRFGLAAGKTGQVTSKKTDWLNQKVSFEVLV